MPADLLINIRNWCVTQDHQFMLCGKVCTAIMRQLQPIQATSCMQIKILMSHTARGHNSQHTNALCECPDIASFIETWYGT